MSLLLTTRALNLFGVTAFMFVSTIMIATTGAEDSILFKNDRDQAFSLYFQPANVNKFLDPATVLKPHSETRVPLSDYSGKRFIVIADNANRFTRIGWVDLVAIAHSPTPRVLIDSVTVTETKEVNYTIQVPVTETKVDQTGGTYSVTRHVPETRTKTITVQKEVFSLKTAINGAWEPINVSNSPTD